MSGGSSTDYCESHPWMDLHSLRKLYRNGHNDRVDLKATISSETFAILKSTVPFGRGLYASSFIALAVRFLAALVGNGEDLEWATLELKRACKSPHLIRNLERVIHILSV